LATFFTGTFGMVIFRFIESGLPLKKATACKARLVPKHNDKVGAAERLGRRPRTLRLPLENIIAMQGTRA
jgi:hypothetical protein